MKKVPVPFSLGTSPPACAKARTRCPAAQPSYVQALQHANTFNGVPRPPLLGVASQNISDQPTFWTSHFQP